MNVFGCRMKWISWAGVCGGFHILFNCFLTGLLGSSQRCKILIERHLETPWSMNTQLQLFTSGHARTHAHWSLLAGRHDLISSHWPLNTLLSTPNFPNKIQDQDQHSLNLLYMNHFFSKHMWPNLPKSQTIMKLANRVRRQEAGLSWFKDQM